MKFTKHIQYAIIGAASAFILIMLGGAVNYSNSSLNFGRYQLSSWSTRLSVNGGVVGAFVMDTVSGETKTVYLRTYGNIGKGKVVKNNLKKTFSAMK